MHHFPVRIYYEDTDHSGRVYHANYLKYFERAREHVLGAEELVRLYRDEGYGFVVYKVEMSFREGAIFGDELDIRSEVRRESDWRIRFLQNVWRPGGTQAAVEGVVELVCVDRDHRLVKLPESIRSRF
jgi:tol-pal system-associated acyl-CoA thioesterase